MPVSGHIATRERMEAAIAADQAKLNDRREQANEIVRIIKLMVPRFILNMDKSLPTFTHGTADGGVGRSPESFYLGYGEQHGVWRQFPTGGSAVVKQEWAQTMDIKNKKFVITQGPVMWSNRCINTTTPMTALSDQDVSFAAVTNADIRYLYVQITLTTASQSTANATCILGANGYYPVDSPLDGIVRWPLSKWSFVVDGAEITPTKLEPVAWAGGRIPLFHVSFGPP